MKVNGFGSRVVLPLFMYSDRVKSQKYHGICVCFVDRASWYDLFT